MSAVTFHRRANGDPTSTRIVEDGFRPSVFFVPPAGLLARGLWGTCLVWLVLVVAIVASVLAGALSPGAALLAILIVHLVLAIDTPDLERRRLERRGWPAVALAGPFAAAAPAVAEPEPPPLPATAAVRPVDTSVIGLFPGERR